jgi:hypothetical protein
MPDDDYTLDDEEEVGSARESFGAHPERRSKADNGVPRWRQIEIMRERRALKALLDDFGDDDLMDLENDVFGSEEEREAYYRSVGVLEEEEEDFEVEIEEDDFEEEQEEE